jgi:hypothetical protein
MDARAWQAVIPTMGYMALLRNLRNFDEAGVPDEVAERVAASLADPGQVTRSRQLPMRFLSAHRAALSLRWGAALERALTASLSHIPCCAGLALRMGRRRVVLVGERGGPQKPGGRHQLTASGPPPSCTRWSASESC